MKAYIRSSSAISAQDSFKGPFPWEQMHQDINPLTAIEPNYKDLISPVKIRRMNRIVKMGITVAQSCLKDASIDKPQAIITGTGWGCLSDTYNFLTEINEKKEDGLSPATFIQSTHNTVGGQIALYFDCQEYNSVYVNGHTSFEQSILDAFILLAEGKTNILVGGMDELAQKDIELKRAAGYWKSHGIELSDKDPGSNYESVPGEGASFFLLSSAPHKDCKCQIDGVHFFQYPLTDTEFENSMGTQPGKIDLILSGYNGDPTLHKRYFELYRSLFPSTSILTYKHLCGEYDTASAFSLWLADQICSFGSVPVNIIPDDCKIAVKNINRILIHHYSEPDQHAIILVSKAGL
jgi:3-oxoacyl-[acyl-carrier-protein] synthase II